MSCKASPLLQLAFGTVASGPAMAAEAVGCQRQARLKLGVAMWSSYESDACIFHCICRARSANLPNCQSKSCSLYRLRRSCCARRCATRPDGEQLLGRKGPGPSWFQRLSRRSSVLAVVRTMPVQPLDRRERRNQHRVGMLRDRSSAQGLRQCVAAQHTSCHASTSLLLRAWCQMLPGRVRKLASVPRPCEGPCKPHQAALRSHAPG